MKKVLLVLLTILAGCSLGDKDFHDQTVMITNLAKNSGGSGSIIERHSDRSLVLTNGHVCGVVKNGGYVISDDGKEYLVSNYRISKLHDLCVIEVAADLKYAAHIAHRAPFRYESATISGHPKLLPTTITKGEFTDKRLITVMMGMRDCTQKDLEDPRFGLFCAIFGKIPLLKSFEAIEVSALIQPGSSGSAIYNSEGSLDAVVFAGAGDLGFAFAVPYEYVSQFLRHELSTIPKVLPVDPKDDEDKKKENSLVTAYYEFCKNLSEGTAYKNVCKLVERHYRR